jgi:hypothetical protein
MVTAGVSSQLRAHRELCGDRVRARHTERTVGRSIGTRSWRLARQHLAFGDE